MGALSGYLADRFGRHLKTTRGRTYRETLDETLLHHVYRTLDQEQRIDHPLVAIREDAIRADPLLTAFSTNDELYTKETVKRYVDEAFSAEGYDGFAGLIDPRISNYGDRHARLIKRLDERLAADGPLSGARFYRDAFEDAYRMQFEIPGQREDLSWIERSVRSKEAELRDQAPVRMLNALFARPDPLLNWVHDALLDYHDFRFTTEALEHRGYEHLSANSHAHLSDHLARKSMKSLLSQTADVVARPLEREIFPGDEVEPLMR